MFAHVGLATHVISPSFANSFRQKMNERVMDNVLDLFCAIAS